MAASKYSLADTAQALMADHKGLLAIDESTETCNKRFAAIGIPQTVEMHRAWRETIITAPGIARSISGMILFDETIRQSTAGGVPFVKVMNDLGILIGIKVDEGAKPLAGHPGETVTEGLDGLRDRLTAYAEMGARFAKWRAVISLDAQRPSPAALAVNAHALARYAALCQDVGLVPIVEPEVLMDGDHSLERSLEATQAIQEAVFHQLHLQGVVLEGMLLKPNMILSGLASARQASVEEVAEATLTCLLRCVPAAVPGIAFLSGGQSGPEASARLNAMTLKGKPLRHGLPWDVSYSYGRAIQQPALDIWHGEAANVPAAQAALVKRADMNRAARRGEYTADMESQ